MGEALTPGFGDVSRLAAAHVLQVGSQIAGNGKEL